MERRPLPTDPSVRIEKVRSPSGFDVWLVGVRPQRFADLYHSWLKLTWTQALGVLAAAYLGVNVVFAALFAVVGGVENAAPGSFRDAFAFSIQTMGTIGYGAMYPQSMAAEGLVAAESVASLIFTALATGLLFARFTRIVSFLRGVDDTTHQPIYAHHRFESSQILYGHRHVDILTVAPDGLLALDQRDFDRVEPLG